MVTSYIRFGLIVLLLSSWPVAVRAEGNGGWMGFRNQTGVTLILQETFPNGRLGSSHKVFANETIRDTPTVSGQRKFTIYNAAEPTKVLFSGLFPTPADRENILYILKSDGKGGLQFESTKIATTSLPPKKK